MPQPLMSDKPLLVVPNPFCVPLDRRGRPCGLVQYDPEHVSGPPRYIGGSLDAKVIERRELTFRSRDHRPSKLDVMALFEIAPVPIVDSAYHREMVRLGALLPADADTAKRLGFKEFAEPAATLEKARAAAIAAWVDQHGEEPLHAAWTDEGTEKEPKRAQLARWPAPAAPTAKKSVAKGGDA